MSKVAEEFAKEYWEQRGNDTTEENYVQEHNEMASEVCLYVTGNEWVAFHDTRCWTIGSTVARTGSRHLLCPYMTLKCKKLKQIMQIARSKIVPTFVWNYLIYYYKTTIILLNFPRY